MRKHMKKFGVILSVILLLVMALTGCGKKVTADSLVKEMKENLEKTQSMTADMSMDMAVAISESGINMDMDMNLKASVETLTKEQIAHITGTMTISLLGLSIDVENYTVVEDDKIVSYTNTAGTWARTEDDDLGMANLGDMEEFLNDDLEYTLAEKTEKVGDQEVYVLTTKISAEDMMKIFGNVSEDLMKDMDMEVSEMNVTLKVDQATKMPVEVTANFGDEMSVSDGEAVSMSIKKLEVKLTYTGFDNVPEIKVPEDVIKNAEKVENPDESEVEALLDDTEVEKGDYILNEDGSYTLQDETGTHSVVIMPVEGYTFLETSAKNALAFDKVEGDKNIILSYLLSESTEDQPILDEINATKDTYEKSGMKDVVLGEVQSMKVGELDVKYVRLTYSFEMEGIDPIFAAEYTAWTRLNNQTVVVGAMVEGDQNMDGELPKIESEIFNKAFAAVKK